MHHDNASSVRRAERHAPRVPVVQKNARDRVLRLALHRPRHRRISVRLDHLLDYFIGPSGEGIQFSRALKDELGERRVPLLRRYTPPPPVQVSLAHHLHVNLSRVLEPPRSLHHLTPVVPEVRCVGHTFYGYLIPSGHQTCSNCV